jgi:hypothetical protein
MKNIINTTLAAIVFAATTPYNLEAKRMRVQPTVVTEQIKIDTKKLEAELKKMGQAKTNAEKEKAKKDVYQAAQELLVDLKEERSLVGDVVSGYSETQIKKARANLEKLYLIQTKVSTTIQKKEIDLAKITEQGWIWNSPVLGKEKDYEALSLNLTKLKGALTRIDRAIRNQKVIAGEEWSNAFRILLSSGLIGTAAIAADIALTGGAGTSLVAGKVATLTKTGVAASTGWLKEKGKIGLEWTKWVGNYGLTAAGTLLTLYTTLSNYYGIYQLAKLGYDQAVITYKELNPNATQEEINAATVTEKHNLEKAETDVNMAKDNYEKKLTELNK